MHDGAEHLMLHWLLGEPGPNVLVVRLERVSGGGEKEGEDDNDNDEAFLASVEGPGPEPYSGRSWLGAPLPPDFVVAGGARGARSWTLPLLRLQEAAAVVGAVERSAGLRPRLEVTLLRGSSATLRGPNSTSSTRAAEADEGAFFSFRLAACADAAFEAAFAAAMHSLQAAGAGGSGGPGGGGGGGGEAAPQGDLFARVAAALNPALAAAAAAGGGDGDGGGSGSGSSSGSVSYVSAAERPWLKGEGGGGYDVVVVGAGASGATLAERYAR